MPGNVETRGQKPNHPLAADSRSGESESTASSTASATGSAMNGTLREAETGANSTIAVLAAFYFSSCK